MKKRDDERVRNLDKTFTALFLVVTIIVVPLSNNYVIQEQPQQIAIFTLLYFSFPTILLVLLWWIATFFDKTSLRIVCWYGLFYTVVHAFWIMLSAYRYLAFGQEFYQSTSIISGIIWILSAYAIPFIPSYFIYQQYSQITSFSSKKVKLGIFIFMVITLGLAFLAIDILTK
jgi:hypothetical protein